MRRTLYTLPLSCETRDPDTARLALLLKRFDLPASEKCQQEKRKTVNGEDILFAMTSTGFENYAEALKIYLAKYREVSQVNNAPFNVL